MACAYEFKETLLTLSGVCLKLGARPVLNDLSAEVRNVVRPGLVQGQVVAVLGPSGVGKTQLLRLVAGLTTPDRGEVRVGAAQEPVSCGKVGVVAQTYPLFEHRTLLSNLLLAARRGGIGPTEARERSERMLARFELAEHASTYPATLSGGQRQRAAIAQQLMQPKSLLLMDEPFSGLDPVMVREVCRLVTELASLDEELTLLVVTHDIAAALAVADTVWLLGRVRDATGASLGARIVERVDLMERGLAWQPDVTHLPAFEATRREVEARFHAL
ncbi:MAG TPA: ATP-binding cassette domain-containing protein [Polyangiaceae bacterium]|nr:ATP-binding cassette domain-containing protein [Polyangiaceae bacterium]